MNNILKIIYSMLGLFIGSLNIYAQQIPNASLIPGSRAILNPAYTAVGSDMIVDGFFRAQWLGFQGSPTSGFISAQYPFVKQNMSAGGFIHFDNTGPVSKVGVQGNYAYKLKEVIGRKDQLSLGLSIDMQQYSFSGNSLVVNDPTDVNLGSRQTSFFPSLGIGAFYMSTTREFKENMFFIGFSASQVFTTNVLVNNVDQTREKHFHANFGGRFYSYDSYIEPMISANLVQPDIINVLYGLRYEKDNTFWAGIGYESPGIAGFQGGVILTDLGQKQNGTMRIGALANYGILSRVNQIGPSIEMYLGYQIGN